MVAGYPDGETDFEVARGLADGGASFIEVQFPFSDPSADGPVIQNACMKALTSGFRVDAGFRLIKRIKAETAIPVFLMSYGSVLFARGVASFVKQARSSGVDGLIVPDLVPGQDEGLYQAGSGEGVSIVPVIPPTLNDNRLREILAQNPAYLYASLRVGITGSRTRIDAGVISFLSKLKKSGVHVFAGFGIQSREQVKRLTGYADTLIVGSEIVRTIAAVLEKGEPLYYSLREKVSSLLEDEETVEAEKTQ
jgi:tryptophan synthase alpha chain